MADTESDPQVEHRLKLLVAGLDKLMAEQKVPEIQTAIANFMCRVAAATKPDDPDKVLIEMHAVLLEVWDAYRLHLKQGTTPPDAILN